jgi:hypothetical protein
VAVKQQSGRGIFMIANITLMHACAQVNESSDCAFSGSEQPLFAKKTGQHARKRIVVLIRYGGSLATVVLAEFIDRVLAPVTMPLLCMADSGERGVLL